MNRITFDEPKDISEVKEQYDIQKVSILTTPNLYPLVKGIEFSGSASFILAKKRLFPIKRKMDAHIEAYTSAMLEEWKIAKKKLRALISKVREVNKLDYNNKATILRIAKIPAKYRQQFVEVADKYDLNLALLDSIVLNPSLMVNARYDNRRNLMELNPDYLKQHGMIRIGDAGEVISETDKTFIHEFGHAYWYNALTEEDRRGWSSLSNFLIRTQLTGDMSQYLVGEKKRFDGSTMYSSYYTIRTEPFVSVYARFNIREDFAESFLYYKVAPKTLEKLVPNKYAFIQDKVGNRIEKDSITKAFAPEIDDSRELKDKIITILDDLKDKLSQKTKDAYKEVYDLGREKGAYHLDGIYDGKLTDSDREKLQQLLERNDEYLDDFIDDVLEEHNNALFVIAPTGMIEGIKEYDDIDEFDQEFEGAMESQEYRLSNFAMAGLGVALMSGLTQEIGEDMPGGYWHTSEDDRVCDGCNSLDGQWMTYDEFWQLYQHNECNIGCRCEELFEPAPAPGDNGVNTYGSHVDDIDLSLPELGAEKMIKFEEEKHPRGADGKFSTDGGEDKIELPVFFTPLPGQGGTGRAIAFGRENKNNPKVIAALKEARVKALSEFETMMKNPNPTKEEMQAAMNKTIEAQLYREAYEAAEEKSFDKSSKVVAVDYHGTLMVDNKVNETIKTNLQEMRNNGYHIIVYTAGTTDSPGALNGIQTWLKDNEIPFDEVWQKQGKPDADIYFEDKAVRPSEIKGKTLKEIENIPKKEDKLMEGVK